MSVVVLYYSNELPLHGKLVWLEQTSPPSSQLIGHRYWHAAVNYALNVFPRPGYA
jgi:hypothetical protein